MYKVGRYQKFDGVPLIPYGVYFLRSQVAEKLRSDLIASVPLYDQNSPDAAETRAWDAMQHDLQGGSSIVQKTITKTFWNST